MDVRCARCSTEYEFDDALVSERGTTVKCTNCGHQFKVYPGGGGDRPPERWIVRKASGRELPRRALSELFGGPPRLGHLEVDGRDVVYLDSSAPRLAGARGELVYTSLKDLQRAIAQRQVGPSDMLSRGGGQALRRLEDIAELEPFFQTQAGTAAPVQRTLLGISPVTAAPPTNTEDTVRDGGPSFADTMASTPGGFAPHPGPLEPPTHDEIEPKTVARNPTPSSRATICASVVLPSPGGP